MIVTDDATQRAKIDIVPVILGAALSEEERWLEHYLQNWSGWMRSKEDLPEACPSEASGGLTPYTSWDSEGMCERMDAEHAELVHVMVWRLSPTERNMIYHHYDLIREPPQVAWPDRVLARAKETVKRSLLRAGLWFGE